MQQNFPTKIEKNVTITIQSYLTKMKPNFSNKDAWKDSTTFSYIHHNMLDLYSSTGVYFKSVLITLSELSKHGNLDVSYCHAWPDHFTSCLLRTVIKLCKMQQTIWQRCNWIFCQTCSKAFQQRCNKIIQQRLKRMFQQWYNLFWHRWNQILFRCASISRLYPCERVSQWAIVLDLK